MAFPSGWARKVAITIDNTKCGTADSSNFTVLLTRANLPDEMCSPSDGNRAQSDGGDIRFSSDSAGATQLALHVERWEYDTSNAAGDADIALNVKVPTVNGTGTGSDSTIYAWYNTTGTDSQPASTDTYGSQNAYDTNHVHVFTLDESPSDTPPEYKDSVGAWDLEEANGTATSPAGKNGGNAFDGDASAHALGDFVGFVTPNNASASPFTNTGLCYIPGDDRIAVVNFDDNKIHEINKSTGAEITSFAVTQGETQLQGLAYDSVADQFIVIEFGSASNKHFYDRNGTYDRTLAIASSGQAVAYDFDDDAIWTSYSSGVVKQHNKTTGAEITSLTLSGAAAGITIEGIAHNKTDGTLFVTTDTGDMVYEINKSTGATIRSFRGPIDIEHPAYDHTDDALWINGDARFHSGASLGENVIYKLNPTGGPYGSRRIDTQYTIEYWLYPDSVAGTTIVSAFWSAVTADGFYHEIQSRSGAIRAYSPDVTYTQAGAFTASTWQHIWCDYDESATELNVYKDNSSVINDTTAAGSLAQDGRISLGGRPNNTLKFNGRFDSVRVHNTIRSSSWRTARFNNTNSPSTFASAGTPEAGSVANRRRRFLQVAG